MKKRLLITSIVMMLVVAVALSTATYAWFTSNNKVTANEVVMTAHVADASSISIGWESGESGTNLTAVAGSQLYPICPVALTGTNAGAYDSSTNSTGLRFNRAEIDVDDQFGTPITTGETVNPYTWISATTSGKDVFYINNDSPAQAVSVTVTATIKDKTNQQLAAETVLVAGKTYYTWAESPADSGTYVATALVAGTDYTAGTSKVGDTGLTVVYDKKPVAKYVKVAIYASDAQNTKAEVLAKTAFAFKGLLGYGGDGNTNDTAVGAIVAGQNKSTVADQFASSSSVSVISNLQGNKAVYLIVKVWIDGEDFTQAEGAAAATVELNFTAANV